jgi:hypothetical protein
MTTDVSSDKLELARRSFDFFTSGGWSPEQAAGLIANIDAESAFDYRAVGDGGSAIGLCQWHPDRQAPFRAQFGVGMDQASFDQQLAYVTFELQHAEIAAGRALQAAGDPGEAGELVCTLYERPADKGGRVRRARGDLARHWFDILAGQSPMAASPLTS